MKIFKLTLAVLLIGMPVNGQPAVVLYNPSADAAGELQQAIKQARDSNRHVLVQVGGNWCPWCLKLHGFIESHAKVDSILRADYILLRINYSPENKNTEVLASLGYPQRFGFPVLLVLDGNGKRLHTQDTGYLEKDDSYDEEKLNRFLLNWNVRAVDPRQYQ